MKIGFVGGEFQALQATLLSNMMEKNKTAESGPPPKEEVKVVQSNKMKDMLASMNRHFEDTGPKVEFLDDPAPSGGPPPPPPPGFGPPSPGESSSGPGGPPPPPPPPPPLPPAGEYKAPDPWKGRQRKEPKKLVIASGPPTTSSEPSASKSGGGGGGG